MSDTNESLVDKIAAGSRLESADEIGRASCRERV